MLSYADGMNSIRLILAWGLGAFLLLAGLFIAVERNTEISYKQPSQNAEMGVASPTELGEATATSTPPPIAKTEAPQLTEPKVEAIPKSSLPPSITKAAAPLPPVVVQPLPSDSLNEKARAALVNILCVAQPGLGLPSIIGSGMMIDPRGIIVTNAHVAEHMLLKDYKVPNAIECTIRNGSPARLAYKAELLYLPPSWIEKNASSIVSRKISNGFGDDDYAFLYVTGSATETPLPETFFSLPIELREMASSKGEMVLSVGYPAELLPDRNKITTLYPITAFSTIKNLYTFTENLLDSLYLSGNAVSQTGASGGGVLTLDGKLVGLIATVSDSSTPEGRDFQAITFAYISRNLSQNAGMTLDEFLHGNPKQMFQDFQTSIAPSLTAKLIAAYEKP